MKPIEALVVLLSAVVGVVLLGRRLKMPYPIALVIGGLCISLIPGLPVVRIDPDLILFIFLPPLLYAAAWFTSWQEFRANLRPIFLLAVGLVLFTTIVIGILVHALIPEIPLAAALAFGAIVSPPDAVAATAIARQMSLPRRIVAVLEGESLVNDATALVALRFGLVAAATGSFSLGQATLEFAWMAAGGLALGVGVAIAVAKVAQFIKDDSLLITLSLLAPYLAVLPADRLHVSGVLAAVAAGLYGGWKGPEFIAASTRLNAIAVWNMLVFLLNCVLFILIGLELKDVVRGLGGHSKSQLISYGAIVSAVVILIRPIWVFPAAWLPRLMNRRIRARDPIPPWRNLAIVSWGGMRGVVSLAAELSLPATLGEGRPFPGRDILIFLTFCVILATLVVQGLSLPFLIQWLGVREPRAEHHEREARLKITQAALDHLNRLAEHEHTNAAALQRVSNIYQERILHLNDRLAEEIGWSADRERLLATRRIWLEALAAERRELLMLRRERRLDEELMHRIEHEMDLEETRLRG